MSGKSYCNGGAFNIIRHSACDGKMRTFSSEKTEKLWVKLHDKKCEICRTASTKISNVYKSNLRAMKGETTKAYLDNFRKNC